DNGGFASHHTPSDCSPTRARLCSHIAIAFCSSRDSIEEESSLRPSKYFPLTPEYLPLTRRSPNACAASSSVERCDPMKFTNQPLVMISFIMGFMFLPAWVVGTTPGDQELTV